MLRLSEMMVCKVSLLVRVYLQPDAVHFLCIWHPSSWSFFRFYPLYFAAFVTIQLKHYEFYHTGIYCILAACYFCCFLQAIYKPKKKKKKQPSTPLPSLLTPALISFLGCCSGSLLSAGLHAALLTFFIASNFVLCSLSPHSHGASLLNCVIWLSLQDFLFPHQICLCVCRPGEKTVGGRKFCK